MIKKDARLGESLIEFMITHWPLTLDSKSELFIDELTQMLDEDSVKENLCKVLSCISIAIESSSRSLAERALDFVMENQIQAMFLENPGPMLSILFPPLFRVARGHWQKSVQLKALNAMNTFMELDPMAFKDVASKFKEDSILERAKKIKKRDLWGAVVQVAVSNDDTIDRETIEGDLTAFYGVSRGRRASKSGKQLMPLKMSTSQQRFKAVVPESEISLKEQQTRIKALATSQSLFDAVPKTIAAKPAPLPKIPEPKSPVCVSVRDNARISVPVKVPNTRGRETGRRIADRVLAGRASARRLTMPDSTPWRMRVQQRQGRYY